MNNIKLNKISLLSLVASILALIIIISSTTWAWVSTNRDLSQSNGSIGMAYDDTTASYDVYKYNIKQNTGELFGGGISNIDFNPYDLIFAVRNRYTPIFARIEIKRTTAMPKTGTLNLTIERNNHNDTNELSRYASSIMRFSAAIDNSYLSFIGNPDTMYRHVDQTLYATAKGYKSFFEDNETPIQIPASSKSFVTVTKNGVTRSYTKADSIVLSIEYNESEWAINSDGEEILNVYLYITYDEGLVNCYRKNMGVGGALGTNIIEFENDLTLLKISYKGGNS